MPQELSEVVNSTKEVAMVKAGATREAYILRVVAALTCKKMTIDKFGEEHFEEDTTNQLRASEIIAKMNGDIKPDILVDNRKATITVNGAPDEIKKLIEVVNAVNTELMGLKESGRQTGRIKMEKVIDI